MISARAKSGFDELLSLSLKTALSGVQGDFCSVSLDSDALGAAGSRLVMLTSSSYVFRIIVMIHFEPDYTTREHFARRSHVAEEDFSEQALLDAICESGNMCCGAFNRELVRHFPHVGLSTPNVLDKRCAQHLPALGAGHLQHFKVAINHATLFHVSLCVCDYGDLDFVHTPTAPDDSDVCNGELEMF